MVSFLTDCPQCGSTIAKDSACPDCQWSTDSEHVAVPTSDTVYEFAERYKTHTRNYTIFMGVSLCTGLVGVITAGLWILVIYRGNVLAFIGIGLMTVLTGVLSAILYGVRQWFPVDLTCPNCDIRLDELGTIESHCPSCCAQLKP